MENNFAVIDIETNSLDINEAKICFVGVLDNSGFYCFTKDNLHLLNNFLKKYDKILGYNSTKFDLPILKNHKINIDYWKHIDVYEIVKKRDTLLFAKGFESLSLKTVAKKLFGGEKGDISYTIFQKETWTPEELCEIKKYLKQDLILTRKIWDFLVEKFAPFAAFISDEDVKKYKHITSSTASFSYKALCHRSGIPELWGEFAKSEEPFVGAYVMEPIKEFSRGNILYLDWSSLYPMIIIQNNLYSSKCNCCRQDEKYHGSDRWKVDGYYCIKKAGIIESVLKEFYLLKKKYKIEKDPREQCVKIICNSAYGFSNKEGFVQTYSPTTASDTCLLGQQIIKLTIKQLEEKGFGQVLMSDTDSVVLELFPDKTKEECLDYVKELSQELSNSFPFPWPEEFNLKLEADVAYIQFFKDDNDKLKKKNYLYVTTDGKMTIKGLDIIQRDCSQLSKLIFEKYLKEQIINNLDCKFEEKYIEKLVYEEIAQNKLILARKFTVRDSYNDNSNIYSAILAKYGGGEHYMIKNFKLGVGKAIKYCTPDEAKDLELKDFDLTSIWKELEPFIIIINEQKTLFNWRENAI